MFKLKHIRKEYDQAGALCSEINLFGFVDEELFLTKSGDLGIVLRMEGVDYECLDSNTIENLTHRLLAAFRIFDEKCRVYQYLFKRNQVNVPFRTYQNPIVNLAIENRIAYLKNKAASLYSYEIYYVVLFERFRYTTSILKSLGKLSSQPGEALRELAASLSNRSQVVLMERQLDTARLALRAKARSFLSQISDFADARILPKQEAFCVLKKILNFSPLKVENARLEHDTFLDYYLCESHVECHRGFLRVDNHYVKVLALKEPSAQTFPLIFKRLLEVQANYFICSEWQKQDPGKSRSFIHSRRRHFHNTKQSLASYVTASDGPQREGDVLVDESKEAQIHDLGEALKEIEIKVNYFGNYSLTVVVYDEDLSKVESACADFYKAFNMYDAQVYEEKYNLFNSYLATVPGNYAFNLRSMLILNTNYADYSLLFTLHCGHRHNTHLNQEYLAVLETNHRTPYYFNLHCKDTAHSVILGRTGSGKTTLLNTLADCIPDHERIVLLEDTAEIQLHKQNVVRFEARREQNGLPAVTIRDLLRTTLRHRPDRVILGEIRGAEAFDLLQLLNTGHSGTLSTVHANSAAQGISRFTTCVLQSGIAIPYRAIKTNIADSLNVIVQIERRPGMRFVSEVLEINGYDPDTDHFDFRVIYKREEGSCNPKKSAA